MPWISKVRTLPANSSVYSDAVIVEDSEGYSLGPHTDSPLRLISSLFFCPASEEQSNLGTSIYVPKSRPFDYKISPDHHERDAFVKINTVPFRPNCMFGFVVSPNSFHGVDEVKNARSSRNLLMHYIKIKSEPEAQTPS